MYDFRRLARKRGIGYTGAIVKKRKRSGTVKMRIEIDDAILATIRERMARDGDTRPLGIVIGDMIAVGLFFDPKETNETKRI